MKIKNKLFALLFCFFNSITPLHADIKVGTLFFYPPFVMSTGDGFDIDLIRTICQRLQENCQIIPMDYHDLFTSLVAGKIDIAIGGIAISPERLQKFAFTIPYMVSKGQFLTLRKSNLNSTSDLEGKKIGAIRGEQDGGVLYGYLLQNFDNKFQIIRYDDMEDLITALHNGDIAAAFVHKSAADYWNQNGGSEFQLLGNAVAVGDGLGIMALPKNDALIQRINQQLQLMEKDNTYLNIYKVYFSGG